MNLPPQIVRSEYMQWAKTLQSAPYNLGNSGLSACPLRHLPVRIEDLELSGASFYGWPLLQTALAAHLKVPENCLVQSTGTSLANHLAMAAVLKPGDDVLIEEPAYELLVTTAGYFRVNIRRFQRPAALGFSIDWESFEEQLTPRTKLVVLTNLHNPSSARLSETDLRRAADLAGRYGARLLVDEVYYDAAFDCTPHTSFGLARNLIVTGSLTKVYGLSGIRCGWILAAPDLAERIWRLNDLFGVIPAHAAERLSALVLQHFDRVAARARGILNPNREVLNRFLESRPDLESTPLVAGTVTFPRLRSGRVEELCERLRRDYETTVVPGRFFERPEHLRIGIGRDLEETAEGLRRLGRALDDLSA